MSSIKCFDFSSQVHTVQALSGSNFFPLTEKASDISMKTMSCAGVIRAKLICVVRACTRVIYSRAGVGQSYWRGLLVN